MIRYSFLCLPYPLAIAQDPFVRKNHLSPWRAEPDLLHKRSCLKRLPLIHINTTEPQRYKVQGVNLHNRFGLKEQMMITNVGKIDQMVRIVLGLVLVLLTIVGAIDAWGWLGLILITTGLIHICPLYSLLGVSTCALAPEDKT